MELKLDEQELNYLIMVIEQNLWDYARIDAKGGSIGKTKENTFILNLLENLHSKLDELQQFSSHQIVLTKTELKS